MVSFSKLLDQGFRYAKCQEVYHPGSTCCEFHFKHTYSFLTSCMKYFLPVVIIPLLTKGRNIQIWDLLMYYIEAFMTGFFVAQSVPISLCGTRALYGRFTKYNFIFIPNTITAWPALFTSARVARLFAASLFQVTLEAVLRDARNSISQTICQSKQVQTIIFMMCSAFILHAVQRNGMKIVWMVKAIPKRKEDESNKCAHDGTCSEFCIKGLAKTLLVGIPLDLLKTFSQSTSKGINFASILKKKLFRLDFPTTLFFLSYTGIYRLTSCLLNHVWRGNPQVKHTVAAFLGGISFCFLPRLTMLCYGVAVCTEISWELFKRHKFENNNKFVEKIKKIPFHRFYITMATGYMVHLYVFREYLVSPLGQQIVSAMTGNQASRIKHDSWKYLASLDK